MPCVLSIAEIQNKVPEPTVNIKSRNLENLSAFPFYTRNARPAFATLADSINVSIHTGGFWFVFLFCLQITSFKVTKFQKYTD